MLAKFKEREFQLALVTTIAFFLSLAGIGDVNNSDIEEAVSGFVAAASIVAFIINRAKVKSAQIQAETQKAFLPQF